MKLFVALGISAVSAYHLRTSGVCEIPIASAAECGTAVFDGHVEGVEANLRHSSSRSRPAGCYADTRRNRVNLVWNDATDVREDRSACTERYQCICADEGDVLDLEGVNLKTANTCDTTLTKDQCERAVRALDLRADNVEAVRVRDFSRRPRGNRGYTANPTGCFVWTNGRVEYDENTFQDNANTGVCTTKKPCVCGPDTPEPTPNPTVSPTGSWVIVGDEDKQAARDDGVEDVADDIPIIFTDSCANYIQKAETCLKAAEVLGYTMAAEYFTIQQALGEGIINDRDPPFCYIEGGVLYFNADGSNTGKCGSSQRGGNDEICLCTA